MPIDLSRVARELAEAALRQTEPPAPRPQKKPFLTTGRAMLLGAGLLTAGRTLASSRGREMLGSARELLGDQRAPADDDEQFDDDVEEEFDDGDEPEAFDDEQPEDEELDEPEDEELDEPEDEESEEPEALDEEPEEEEEEEEPKPRRTRRRSPSRGRA